MTSCSISQNKININDDTFKMMGTTQMPLKKIKSETNHIVYKFDRSLAVTGNSEICLYTDDNKILLL